MIGCVMGRTGAFWLFLYSGLSADGGERGTRFYLAILWDICPGIWFFECFVGRSTGENGEGWLVLSCLVVTYRADLIRYAADPGNVLNLLEALWVVLSKIG